MNQLHLAVNTQGVEIRIKIGHLVREFGLRFRLGIAATVGLYFGSLRNQMLIAYSHPVGQLSLLLPVSSRIIPLDFVVIYGAHRFMVQVSTRDM